MMLVATGAEWDGGLGCDQQPWCQMHLSLLCSRGKCICCVLAPCQNGTHNTHDGGVGVCVFISVKNKKEECSNSYYNNIFFLVRKLFEI